MAASIPGRRAGKQPAKETEVPVPRRLRYRRQAAGTERFRQAYSGGGAPWGECAPPPLGSDLSQSRRWGSPLWGRPLIIDRTVHSPGDVVLRWRGTTGGRLLSGWGVRRAVAFDEVRVVAASMTMEILPL